MEHELFISTLFQQLSLPCVILEHGWYYDVMFLVDSSTSANWPATQSFSKGIVNFFNIAPKGAHVAYVTFADTANLGISFPKYDLSSSGYAKEDVFSLIDAVSRSKGDNRMLHLGLNEAVKAFSEKMGGRKLARKVSWSGTKCYTVFCITTGNAQKFDH